MALVKKTESSSSAGDQREHGREYSDLVAQLEADNPLVRRWAARDLSSHACAIPALLARLVVEPEVSVREVVLSTLVRLKEPTAVRGLAECLRSEDAALRNEAIEALKQFPDGVAALMPELFADPNADVRIFAVNILESLCHPDVEKWLLEVIDHDPHINVCATAVDLLAEVGGEPIREPLGRLRLRFPDEPYLAFAIAMAVRRIDRT